MPTVSAIFSSYCSLMELTEAELQQYYTTNQLKKYVEKVFTNNNDAKILIISTEEALKQYQFPVALVKHLAIIIYPVSCLPPYTKTLVLYETTMGLMKKVLNNIECDLFSSNTTLEIFSSFTREFNMNVTKLINKK